MITTELFIGLITFYFVMFMTPGPNNIMLTISGIKFGFKKTIPRTKIENSLMIITYSND